MIDRARLLDYSIRKYQCVNFAQLSGRKLPSADADISTSILLCQQVHRSKEERIGENMKRYGYRIFMHACAHAIRVKRVFRAQVET